MNLGFLLDQTLRGKKTKIFTYKQMVTLHNGKRGRLAKKIRKKIKNQKILTLSPTQKNPNPPPPKKPSHQEPKTCTYLPFPLSSHYHPCTGFSTTLTTSITSYYLLIMATTPQHHLLLFNPYLFSPTFLLQTDNNFYLSSLIL